MTRKTATNLHAINSVSAEGAALRLVRMDDGCCYSVSHGDRPLGYVEAVNPSPAPRYSHRVPPHTGEWMAYTLSRMGKLTQVGTAHTRQAAGQLLVQA